MCRYVLYGRFRPPEEAINLSLLPNVQTASGVHPASYPMGTWGPYSWGNTAGDEAVRSSPPNTEVKKMWIYTSTPPYAFMAWYLIKHRDNFAFL
jgi:hypothetical protein